ncbi:HFR062Wp [Eremothecium sinecaudum]|uniref:HFR062Wp n=1 Tax=Eremothecium sinecaudum TaxID=45286 RepID=A0A109UXV7_9SACH|nr:HFR062Wp [Eremothecium sinecaudum]AMD21917.1 HFR062Wp [Eremothecium sinecaudum]
MDIDSDQHDRSVPENNSSNPQSGNAQENSAHESYSTPETVSEMNQNITGEDRELHAGARKKEIPEDGEPKVRSKLLFGEETTVEGLQNLQGAGTPDCNIQLDRNLQKLAARGAGLRSEFHEQENEIPLAANTQCSTKVPNPSSLHPGSPKLCIAQPNSTVKSTKLTTNQVASSNQSQDITDDIDKFLNELRMNDSSAQKILKEFEEIEASTLRSKPIFLLTSLAGGGFQMPSRTNNLANILSANKIEFQYRDCGTDEEARNWWKKQSKGRTLPGIVVGNSVVGNWQEIIDANESCKVRQVCGLQYL